jgi:hypothetical protein
VCDVDVCVLLFTTEIKRTIVYLQQYTKVTRCHGRETELSKFRRTTYCSRREIQNLRQCVKGPVSMHGSSFARSPPAKKLDQLYQYITRSFADRTYRYGLYLPTGTKNAHGAVVPYIFNKRSWSLSHCSLTDRTVARGRGAASNQPAVERRCLSSTRATVHDHDLEKTCALATSRLSPAERRRNIPTGTGMIR